MDDCRLLFDWANDEEVRANAIHMDQIRWEDHLVWFEKKIRSEQTKIFIMTVDKLPIGQIRYDLNENNEWIIDYSIATEHRGKGYGYYLLKETANKVKKSILIALVKQANLPSQILFEKSGFDLISKEIGINEISYYKYRKENG